MLLLHEHGAWSVVDVDRGRRVRVLRANYFGVSRSPDGARIAHPCGQTPAFAPAAVCIVRIDGQAPAVRIRPPVEPAFSVSPPVWSPDGRRLAFAVRSLSGRDDELWTANRDGTGLRRVSGGRVGEPVWSPNSRLIAHAVRAPGNAASGLYVVASDGGEPRRLTARVSPTDPRWAPRGALIAYLQNAPGKSADGLYLVRAGGSGARRLARLRTERVLTDLGSRLNWSADGRYLAYVASTRRFRQAAFVLDVRTGRRTALGAGWARFAPHGRDIVVMTEAPLPATLYRGRITLTRPGGRPRAVLDEHVMAYQPIVWSRDGRRIAYMKKSGLWVADLPTRKRRLVLRWNLRDDHAKGPLLWGFPASNR